MPRWNRSSVTRLVRSALGPLAFARPSGTGVELGIGRDGKAFVFAWADSWDGIVLKLHAWRKVTEQPRVPGPSQKGDASQTGPGLEPTPDGGTEGSLEPSGPTDGKDP